MPFVTAVKIIGILIILAGMVFFLVIKRTTCYSPIYKLIAPLAFLVVPILVLGVGNYHVFEGSQKVSSCLGCHVMAPMVNDMRNPQSMTLAARH